MKIVRFAAYREYEAARVETSDAMMGLLAGAKLASHLLGLHEGSSLLLPDMYPQVPHINRLNLTRERASQILESADEHLGAMGVPYALSVHEDYMKTCLELLGRSTTNVVLPTPIRPWPRTPACPSTRTPCRS